MNRLLRPLILILFLTGSFLANPVLAQDVAEQVPEIERAETYFEQALASFEAGNYEMAYRRFQIVYETFPFNRKTTAAMLMAGKALYRAGEHREAVSILSEFVRSFPQSSYVDDAQQTLELARQELAGAKDQVHSINLGVLLPMRSNDVVLSQSLFNGIRLAVEEHNATPGAVPVRMVFRDSGGDPRRVAQAVAELANEEQVDAIVGPIFSSEAIAAAAAAEQHRVVLITPLATDEAVAKGKQHVFQANPTITLRGRQMARYAVQELGLRRFGVIAEDDDESISARMAEGFQDEALQLGAEVKFFTVFPDPGGWGRLPEEIGTLQMSGVEAVYMPLPGSNTARKARAALEGLAEMNSNVRVLGNSEWNGLNLGPEVAAYNPIYTSDFLIEESDPEVQSFVNRYQAVIGEVLAARDRRLPVTSYDVTRFLLQQAARSRGRLSPEVLREAPAYEGIGLRIDFSKGEVNDSMYVLGYRDGEIQLVQ